MKRLSNSLAILVPIIFFVACSHGEHAGLNQEKSIDSVRQDLAFLKPGLGEFMVQLEFHESRLAKSIATEDYERAGFETDEMMELTEKIEQLHISNDKLKLPFSVFNKKYLSEPLNAIKTSAEKKDEAGLKSNLTILISNCNSCHKENNMGFMKINY